MMWFEGDPAQLQNAILNIAINARDAMPKGGTLTIETHNIQLDEKTCATYMGADPGEHVIISVSDTGCGMSEETQANIFEPFFSTKSEVVGTGLGLYVSYAIVQRHQGDIRIDSQPGQGSTFTVTLPVASWNNKSWSTYPPANVLLPWKIIKNSNGIQILCNQ